MTIRVRVRLLGGFGVEVDGAAVPDRAWDSRRSRQLVAFLALSLGRRAMAEQVMDVLWPDLDPDAARANLHKAASLARRAMGSKDSVVFRAGAVALWPTAEIEVDLEHFEQAATAAIRSGAEACLDVTACYHGVLLPEERYEDWAATPRERARELLLDLLRAGGQWAALVEADPTDEPAHRELMREHLAAGRLHAALRQFQRLRTTLRRELGVQPSEETTALYRQVLGTAASGWVRPGLVGREVELVRARAALRRAGEGRPAAILLTGPPGIGKTRLAEELVEQAAADGWLVLRASAREPTASVPYACLAEAIGAALVQRPELAGALGDDDRQLLARIEGTAAGSAPALVHRQSVLHLVLRVIASAGAPNALLFIDDLQHADDATVELAHILASAPYPRGLLLIVTYREEPGSSPPPASTGLRDALVANGVATEMVLGPLRRPEIEEIVADVRGETPSAEELELVWELSGGNAFLALEMASSTDAVAATLAEGVHTAIAARMRALDSDAQQALRRVALVADAFTADEFAALADLDADAALDHLEAATTAGVVARRGSSYRFRHDLVRDEFRRGVAPAEVSAVHAAAAERLAALDAPAARVAHHLVAAGQPTDALPWLRRAVEDAFAVGAHADALALADQALSLAPRQPDLLAQRAAALDSVGDPRAPAAYAVAMAAAEPAMRGSLAVRRAKSLVGSGDVSGALETLAGIEEVEPADAVQLQVARGLALWCTGDIEAADEAGRAARALAEDGDSLRDFVDATMLTAMVAHQRGVWPQRASLDLLDASLRPELATVVMDAHLCVAESYLYGGAPYAEVVAFATDLLERAAGSGAARAEAFATTLLGEAHLLMGETGMAGARLAAAVGMHRRVGVLCGEALSLQRLAEVRMADGDVAGARATLDEAFLVARGSPVATRHLLDRIHGTAVRAAPDAEAAVAAVDEAAQAVRGPFETCQPCSVTFAIPATIACAAAGQVDRARHYLTASERVAGFFFPQGGWQAALDEARAHVAMASGDAPGAARLLQQAGEGFERWGQRLDATRCRRSSTALDTSGKV